MAEVVAISGLHDSEDSELIVAVRNGNLEAYGVLYYRHCTAAMKVAQRWTNSTSQAEDLVAESFTAVLDALRQGKGPSDNFPIYLATAVRNLSARWAERGKRMCTVEDLEFAVDSVERSPAAEDTVLDLSERALVAGAFRRLSERDRMALWLVDVEGRSYADAATKMGLSTQALGTLLSRARESLRDEFVASHIDVKSHSEKSARDSLGFQPSAAGTARNSNLAGADQDDVSALNHPSALRLSRYARGKTPPRYRPAIEHHLSLCPRCRLLAKEAHEVGSTVRGLAAPMLLAPFVLDPPAGAPPAPVPAFPVDVSGTGTGGSVASWVASKTSSQKLFFGLGAFVLVGILIFTLTIVKFNMNSHELAAQDSGGLEASLEDRVATPNSDLEVTWDRGDTADVPAGSAIELPFTIKAHKAVPMTASVSFLLTNGVTVRTQSPACTVTGRAVSCGGIGPFDEGQVMNGILVVDLASSGPPPAASIQADGSWPRESATAADDAVVTDGATAIVAVGEEGVVVRDTSIPMFGTVAADEAQQVVQYTPNPGYRGADGFLVTITDEIGQTAQSSVGVVVKGNDS